jgi:predicted helicase
VLRVPFGYRKAKDEKDDIDAKIDIKFRRGYPKTNILFEDSTQAVLIQNGEEVMRCGVEDVANLEKLLKLFFGYARPEIEAFRKAVVQFKVDLPAVLEALRAMIAKAYKDGPVFPKAAGEFLEDAQDAINPSLIDADVRENLIQHILTGEVFAAVFPGTNFHEDNRIARELHKLEATFFTGDTKHQTLIGLAPYYTAIRKTATEIATHHEKQMLGVNYLGRPR